MGLERRKPLLACTVAGTAVPAIRRSPPRVGFCGIVGQKAVTRRLTVCWISTPRWSDSVL
jgi:hypothetical protein